MGLGKTTDAPFCCGPRMRFVPGFHVDHFICENCGSTAVRTKLGFRVRAKGAVAYTTVDKPNVDQFREQADEILDEEKYK